jgi:hypothetical protein
MQLVSPLPRRLEVQGSPRNPKSDIRSGKSPFGRKSADQNGKQEEENLLRQIREVDAQIEKFKETINGLKEKNQSLNEENLTLEVTWRKELQELDNQRQALTASRSFVAREGTLDAQGLIQGFNDLNASIGDFSYEILRRLDESTEARVLEKRHYEQIDQVFHDESLTKFLSEISSKQLTTMDILDPIVQYSLCSQLMHTIFRPFAPGLDMDRSISLRNIYQSMRWNEPQERCARWRSITYTHVATMRSDKFVLAAVEQCVSDMSKVLAIISEQPDFTLPGDFTTMTTKIFESAIKVQDKAKTEYFSFDYDVNFAAYGDNFDSKRMKLSQAGEDKPGKVWLTVGLGLVATKSVMTETQSISVEESVPVETLVMCDNWDPNA